MLVTSTGSRIIVAEAGQNFDESGPVTQVWQSDGDCSRCHFVGEVELKSGSRASWRRFKRAGTVIGALCFSRWVYLYIVIEVVAALGVSVLLRSSIALFVIDPLLFYPVFALHIHHWRIGRLFAVASLWGIWKSVLFVAAVWGSGDYLDGFVSGAPTYHRDTLNWIRTGEGTIAQPEVFTRSHLAGLARVSTSAAGSCGLTTLIGGSRELNIMNFHVAKLLQQAKDPWTILFFGWPIWSLLRGWAYLFVISGTAPLFLDIVHRRWPVWRRLGVYFLIGVVLAGVDVGLKILLAPWWRCLLLEAL